MALNDDRSHQFKNLIDQNKSMACNVEDAIGSTYWIIKDPPSMMI